jgi:hypothetical protein
MDFDPCFEPNLEDVFNVGVDAPAKVPIIVWPIAPHPAPTDALDFSHVSPKSECRSSVSSECGLKEWVPKRRRRTKNPTPEKESPETDAQEKRDGASMYSSLPRYPQGVPATQNDEVGALYNFAVEFERKCAPCSAMRLALLVWLARSSASDKLATDPVTASWYSRASAEVDKLMTLPDAMCELGVRPVRTSAEVIICASLFLNQYDVWNYALDSIDGRFRRISDWLAKHPNDLGLSPLASKMLLWTCYLQIRLGIFNTRSLPSTTLLELLGQRAEYIRVLENSQMFQADIFGPEHPKEHLAADAESIPATLHLHEAFCVLAKVARYRYLQQTSPLSAGSWGDLTMSRHRDVEDNIQRLEGDFQLAAIMNDAANDTLSGLVPGTWRPPPTMSTSPTQLELYKAESAGPCPSSVCINSQTPNRESLDWLTAYAVFLATKILWSRAVFPSIRTDHASIEAVESILQAALHLRRARGREDLCQELPSALWLLPLFVAGIETVDEVRADWVRMFVCGVAEVERDGNSSRRAHARKVLDLMEHLRAKQDQQGSRVCIEEAMREIEGPNGVFMFLG